MLGIYCILILYLYTNTNNINSIQFNILKCSTNTDIMIIKRLMWMSIFNNISYPSLVSDVLADATIFGVGADKTSAIMLDVDMLPGMEIIVMGTPVITLDFVVGLAYAVDVLADLLLLTVLIIDVAPAIDVDMLDDENADGLAAAMTPLEFTLPASWREESMSFC